MGDIEFSVAPPPHWASFCDSHRALFHSPAWQGLIDDTLGSTSLYGWNEGENYGLAVNVFRAGIFRVGYLGFPVGGTVGDAVPTSSLTAVLSRASFPSSVHCLRIPASAFDREPSAGFPRTLTPETAITRLQDWRLDDHADLRRDINKARRNGMNVKDNPDADVAETAFRLYSGTVRRNRGNLRYTSRYFHALVRLAKHQSALRFLFAAKDGEIAGFGVFAHHGDTVFYLHGGTSEACRRYSPGDLLIYDAICWARQRRVSCFNLMTSPPKQASLIKYKEKWGGTTRDMATYTLPIRYWRCRAFLAAERLYRLLR